MYKELKKNEKKTGSLVIFDEMLSRFLPFLLTKRNKSVS